MITTTTTMIIINIGGRSSQTQLCQLRCLFAVNGKLHVLAIIGHHQVFSQMNLGSKNIYVMRVYLCIDGEIIIMWLEPF
jgi:hypothetical protein